MKKPYKNILRQAYVRTVRRRRLLKDLEKIFSDRKVRGTVLKRLRQFEEARASRERIFSELCFCILTANCSAEGGLRVQEEIGEGFLKLSRSQLSRKLRSLGYRYPNTRAKYIVEARKRCEDVLRIINEDGDPTRVRRWLADNVPGIGFKEASHFLRNIGFKNLAIIDKHVLRVLHRYGYVESIPQTLSRAKYLEIEKVLSKIAGELNMTLAELDLYLWYMDTGRILK
ncbi:MAG: N-glycosylase/DNA lyase [Thermoproteota archaeon]